jgi:hypothetical protein
MRSIYKEADKVLVLEESLLQTTLQGTELQEPLLQILCSSWSRRLWTFQEGVLSKSLHFQFNKKTLHKDDLYYKRFFQQRRQEVQNSLYQGIDDLNRRGNGLSLSSDDWKWIAENRSQRVWDMGMHDLLGAAKLSFGRVHGDARFGLASRDYKRLAFIFSAFQWRSTSKPEDEAICMAVLLGQKTSPLLSLQPAERIKRLILTLSKVPSDILFLAGPRSEEEGQRWIPTSFFNQFHLPPSIDQLSSYSSRGLNVVYSGYQVRFDNPVNIPPTAGAIRLFVHGHDYPFYVFAPDSTWDKMDATLSDRLVNGKKILWHKYVSRDTAIILRPFQSTDRIGFGVLVTIQERVRDVLFSRFEATVVLDGLMGRNTEPNSEEYPAVTATALPPSQKWCVG